MAVIYAVENSKLYEYKEIKRFADSMDIPFINLAYENFETNREFKGRLSENFILEAFRSVIKLFQTKRFVLVFDQIPEFQRRFHERVKFVNSIIVDLNIKSYHLPVGNNEQLTRKYLSSFKDQKIKHYILLVKEETCRKLLPLIKDMGLFRQDYFWIFQDFDFLSPNDILNILPDFSNVLIIRNHLQSYLTCDSLNGTYCDLSKYKSWELDFNVILNKLKPHMNWSFDSITNCDRPVKSNLSNQVLSILHQINSEQPKVHIIATKTNFHGDVPQSKFVNSAHWIPAQGLSFLPEYYSSSQRISLYPNTFLGFNGKTLRICTINRVYVNILGDSVVNVTTDKIRSYLTNIVNELATLLNFTALWTQAPDNGFGAKIEGEEFYSGCVGEIQKKNADVAIQTFLFTHIRAQVVDYLTPMYETKTGILLLSTDSSSGSLWKVFFPLSNIVWGLFVCAAFLAGIASFMLAFFSPFSAWNMGIEFRIKEEIRCQEHMWSILGSFFQQGQDFYPYCMSSRCVLAMWWFFTIIAFSSYSANLTSFLTVSNEGNRIQTVEQLANQNEIKLYVYKNTAQESNLRSANYEPLKSLSRLAINSDDFDTEGDECEIYIQKKSNYRLACIKAAEPLISVMKRSCGRTYMLQDYLWPGISGYLIQKDSMYEDALNHFLKKLLELGFREFVYESVYEGLEPDCPPMKSREDEAIALSGLGGVFIALGILYGLGILILTLELIWYRVLQKSTLSCGSFY